MEELLPYFERELAYLNGARREFAERFPKLAGELQLLGEAGKDPHIERLIQACALLNARTAKKLDDDYPELTEALLGSLYPHFLRGMPPCSIVRFEVPESKPKPDAPGARPTAVSAPVTIPRGTEMASLNGSATPCRFRSTSEVMLAPLAICQTRFDAIVESSALVRYRPGVTSKISLTVDSTASTYSLAEPGMPALRVFADGDPSLCAALLDCLFMRCETAYLEVPGEGPWRELDSMPIALAGFGDQDALLPTRPSEHPAYRLLTEYFAFPEKFNFFDIDLTALVPLLPPEARRFSIHFALSGLNSDASQSRLLKALSPRNLLLGCTPVVNLFRQAAVPIRINQTASLYDVVPASNAGEGCEVYSVDSVRVIKTSDGRASDMEFRPYYALRHGEGLSGNDRFWFTRRNELQATISPGHELKIGFVDIDFGLGAADGCIASIETTCSNRDRAPQISIGAPGGDLKTEGGANGQPVRMLRKPTAQQRFPAGAAMHWRLIAQLALNHHTLAALEPFREMLTLYNAAQSTVSQRQIAGVMALESSPATAWIRHPNGASLVHGTEVRLTLDEPAFAGSCLYAFAQVVNNFFGLYVHLNSFTRLVVLSRQTGKELLRCAPRNGSLTLV
jgi:type VI secretion system protein ImpG